MAAQGTRVGTGYIPIEPDFDRFQEIVGKRLTSALTPAMQKAGKDAGKEIARGADTNLSQSMRPVLRRFERFGADASDAITKGLRKRRSTRATGKAVGEALGLDAMSDFFAQAKKSADKNLSPIERITNRLRARMRGLGGEFRQIGRELRQLNGKHFKGLFGELRQIGRELRRTDQRARVTSSGFGGFDGVMSRVNRGFSFFRNILRTLKWPLLIASLGLATQGLSALAAGLVAATSAIGPLAGALVALPAAATLAAQAFGALKLATAGVGDALKAALDLQIQGGEQATDVMQRQRDAAEQVADAKRSLSETERQATFATEDLTRAREEARRELEDMRLAADESGDSVESSVLSLRRAQQELRRVMRDPETSILDVREAEESVDQAQNDLKRTRMEAKRAREDYRDAQKVGVEGMPQVVAAKRAEQDAARAVGDAERDLARAIRDSNQMMREQGSAATALQQKMSQLPPAAQAFIRQLVALKPRLDDLRSVAAENLFPGVSRGLRAMLRNFGPVRGIIGQTSKALGGLAARAGRRLGSAEWGRDLRKLAGVNTRAINRLGDAAVNLGDAFRHILVTAGPFLDWLSESTLQLSEWIEGEAEAGRESRLAGFFDRTRKTMELLGPILKGVGGALLNIGEAARPLGNQILEALGGAAEGWRKWTGSVEGQNRLKQYFTESKPAIFEMGRLIRDAGKAFFELGRQRGVAHLLRLVRTELIPALTDLFGTMTGFASSFLKQFGELRREGVPAFEAFVQVLAEHAAQAGWRIAKGLGNAFLNASFWGKLVIGGWLLHKFGGLGAVTNLGARMGKRLGAAMLGKLAPTIAAEMAAGSKLGEILSTRMYKLGKIGGRRFAAGVAVGLATLGYWLGQQIGKSLSEETQAGIRQWAINAGENFVNALIWAINKGIGKINDVLDKANVLGKLVDAPNIGRVGRVDFDDGGVADLSKRLDAMPKHDFEAARRAHRDHANFIGREAKRGRENFRKQLDLLPPIALRSGKGINQNILPRLDHLADEGGVKGRKFAGLMGGAFTSVAEIARRAMDNLNANIREALKGLNIGKVPNFNLKKLPPASSLPSPGQLLNQLPERQRGGVVPAFATGGLASVVPGHSTGDRHTLSIDGVPAAKVESREGIFVGNRTLMSRLHELNSRFPRFGLPKFQTGGILGGLGAGASSLARNLLSRFGGVISSGLRPGDDGFHGRGMAVDWVGGNWAGAARYMNSIGPSLLEGIYTGALGGPAVSWDSGQRVSPSFWGSATWGAHGDHIHGAVAGAVRAAIRQLKRLTLTGPDGPLKGLGQAAIDKVWKAANKFLSEQSMLGPHMFGGLTASGSGADLMREISKQRGWNFADWWELDRRETNHGADIYNESSGASLRAQFLPMNFGKYGPGSDPAQNPTMAEQILSMAEYIAERYGNPSAALDFHDVNNWYKTGGLLKSAGLQAGGWLPGFKRGGEAKGEGRRRGRPKYAPMQRQLERLKSLGLDGATLDQLSGRLGNLTRLSEQAETFSEFASNASSLRIEPENGPAIPGLFQGRSEGEWLGGQLQALGSLRNELIAARSFIEEQRERVRKMIERAKKQVEQLKAQIQRAIQKRVKLVGALGQTRELLAKVRDDKDPERRKDQAEKAQGTIAKLLERIRTLDFRQGQRKELINHLIGDVLPRLTERFDGLDSAFTGTMEGGEGFIGLNAVQGRSGPINVITGLSADQPPIGTLGGEILGVQSKLREIAEDARVKASSGQDGDERASLAEQRAREARQREAITEGLFADFRQFVGSYGLPKLPTFHEGGILPGPRGQEVPFLGLGGEGVFTEEQMEAMGAAGGNAGPLVIERLTVHKDGRVTGRMYGREFEAEVKRVVQDMEGTGRNVPGGARGW